VLADGERAADDLGRLLIEGISEAEVAEPH
jgi:hypothetical protein